MSKTIIFSTTFPSYHPLAGQKTYFVEKIWESIGLPDKKYSFNCPDEYQNFLRQDGDLIWEKHHTIRKGNRWKVGDKFSPRVWSGKPYQSKQIIIAPDIEIKKVWDIIIEKHIERQGDYHIFIKDMILSEKKIKQLAKNDGFDDEQDFIDWFPEVFLGQIIYWNEKIKY